MTMTLGDGDGTGAESISFAHLRETLKDADLPALRESGLLDQSTIDHLMSYKRHYEPGDAEHYEDGSDAHYYYNTGYYTEIVEQNISKNLRRAVKNGNLSVVQHALGIMENNDPGMDFAEYERLRQLISEDGLLLLVSGGTGSGKTDTCLRLVEMLRSIYPDASFASNIKSLAENHDWITYVADDVHMLAWAASTPGRCYMLGDEWSSTAGGHGKQGHMVKKKMREPIRKARKRPYQMGLIVIGHRVTDIAPTLRNDELAYYLRKEGDSQHEKRRNMTLYDISGDDDLHNPIAEISGIKATTLEYSTNDTAQWDWAEGVEWDMDSHRIVDGRCDYEPTAANADSDLFEDTDERGSEEIDGSGKKTVSCWNIVSEDAWERCHTETPNDNHICDDCREKYGESHWSDHADNKTAEGNQGDDDDE